MTKIITKTASLDDFDEFYRIKCEDNNIYWSGHESAPNYNNLKAWYIDQLKKPNRTILITFHNNNKIGYAYIDTVNSTSNLYEISYAISIDYQGKGYGSALISECIKYCKLLGAKNVIAKIFETNIGSIKAAKKNGFFDSGKYQMKRLSSQGKLQKFKIYKISF